MCWKAANRLSCLCLLPMCFNAVLCNSLLKKTACTLRVLQASDELLAGASTQTAQELVQLVRSCAEALGSIEDCRSKLRAGS